MINDEWEVFKKEVKPIKESGIIKDSSKKKTFKNSFRPPLSKVITKQNARLLENKM